MLNAGLVWETLNEKQAQFQQIESQLQASAVAFQTAISRVIQMDKAGVTQRLAEIDWPGARPTDDLDMFVNLVTRFAPNWRNHEASRRWAAGVLEGNPTFAVDGSQILPSKEISIPLGLIQVGWFENSHTPNGSYDKNVAVEILTAADVANNRANSGTLTNETINGRRFLGEIQRLIQYMQSRADSDPKPICFYDGSLIVSFAQQLHPSQQKQYVTAVRNLLQTSAQTRIPVVGFVDTSYAKDLVTMLSHLFQIENMLLSDAALLRPLMAWGDRSQVFVCARNDAVIDKYYDDVFFTYLKTNADMPPARVEFPRWVYEYGEHERVLDLVRAETIIGLGYPYAIETADAVAVLTGEDRQNFYRLVQLFSDENNLSLRISRKSRSKMVRRKTSAR